MRSVYHTYPFKAHAKVFSEKCGHVGQGHTAHLTPEFYFCLFYHLNVFVNITITRLCNILQY